MLLLCQGFVYVKLVENRARVSSCQHQNRFLIKNSQYLNKKDLTLIKEFHVNVVNVMKSFMIQSIIIVLNAWCELTTRG